MNITTTGQLPYQLWYSDYRNGSILEKKFMIKETALQAIEDMEKVKKTLVIRTWGRELIRIQNKNWDELMKLDRQLSSKS